MAPSVEAVKASCNLSGQDAPTTVIASGFSGRFVDKKATKEVQLIICYMWYPDYELSRLLSRFSFRQERAEDWSWLDLDGEDEIDFGAHLVALIGSDVIELL